jgi:1,4-alpha-glucan branching enzyme
MFGGSNVGNFGEVWTQDIPWQNRDCSLNIQLPPLAAVFFQLER